MTYRTKAGFIRKGTTHWVWLTWTNNEPSVHAAVEDKAREINASHADTSQSTHLPIDRWHDGCIG